MLKPQEFNHLSTYFIAHEAEKRGIKVKKLINKGAYDNASLLELKHNNISEYIVGQRISKTDCVAFWLQKNKYFAKIFFKKAGLSVANGEVFFASDAVSIKEYVNKIGYPVVVKKITGIHGNEVFVNIVDEQELLKILKKFSGKVLVESMFEGTEYRMFATREKFVAATKRVPANVLGDGISTVKQLVIKKNQDPRRSDGYSTGLVTIKLDSDAKAVLSKQGLTFNSVPKLGEVIYLRENSNLSTGGDSIDVTDELHPSLKQIAVSAVRAIPGLAYAGVDVLVNKDIDKPATKKSYVIIEVNDSPMISMHHCPYEGKERNAAGAIIDMLFPKTKIKAKINK